MAALKDGKPRGFTALLGEVSFSHNTLQQHLDRLVAQGFVVKKKTASNNLGRPKFNYRVPSATRMRVPKLIVSLVPLIGVSNEEIRNSRTLFSKVDLTFAQKALNEPFHPAGSPGRPQRNPLGILKAHLVKRLKRIPSDRMLVRQMWNDPRLKKICDIEANEPPYGIAVLSRFRSKIGPERLARIVDQTIEVLVKNGRIKGEALALDSTFIKAYSRRNLDNRTGYSDPESRIGRSVKAKDLGYRLHLAIDVKSELPIAMIVVSANENEKKHSISLFTKALEYVKPGKLLADSQYSAANLRETVLKGGALPVIPYPRNQQVDVRGILRVDRKFRSHGPQKFRRAYRKRVAVERVFSRLKPGKPHSAQSERISQNNISFSTLHPNHAD